MDRVSLKDDGSNFVDWDAQLRSAAISDGKLRYLVDPPPSEPGARATAAARTSFDEYERESNAIKNVLIYSIAPSLQRRLISLNAYEIFSRLSTMFSQAPRISEIRGRRQVLRGEARQRAARKQPRAQND